MECSASHRVWRSGGLETIPRKPPLSALATHALASGALRHFDEAPEGLFGLSNGRKRCWKGTGRRPSHRRWFLPRDRRLWDARLARVSPPRFARAILELGGNNAAIVTPSADLDLAIRAIAFAAMGTTGQRCTTLRRLFVHDSVYNVFMRRLSNVYTSAVVGDPREGATLIGPLIDRRAFEDMQRALDEARDVGGMVQGGERLAVGGDDAYYVRPAFCEMPAQINPMLRETFAPILYIMRYSEIDDAIRLHNAVGAGLSSCIFTLDMREAERFLSTMGSDCGIANVNIGPSGAEIGGAFGGEKKSGGGREAGSDAWKAYMRRATNTINFGTQLPLAQGVRFDIEE